MNVNNDFDRGLPGFEHDLVKFILFILMLTIFINVYLIIYYDSDSADALSSGKFSYSLKREGRRWGEGTKNSPALERGPLAGHMNPLTCKLLVYMN